MARWSVGEPEELDTWVPLTGQFAVRKRFVVPADRDPKAGEDLHVRIEVGVEDGRARALSVCASSSSEAGVNSTALRAIEIRNIVAYGMLKILCKVRWGDEGPEITPVTEKDDKDTRQDGWDAVKAAIGWVS
jgi:hypothetical protein